MAKRCLIDFVSQYLTPHLAGFAEMNLKQHGKSCDEKDGNSESRVLQENCIQQSNERISAQKGSSGKNPRGT